MKTPALRLAAALLLAALGSCSSAPKEPDPAWSRAEVEAPSGRVLWEYAILALNKTGFPLGSQVDPTTLTAESGWKNTLLPFKGQGFRQKALVRIHPEGEGRYEVEVRVQKQTNEALARPTDLRYAEWEWTEDDAVAAGVLLHHIRAYLLPSLEPQDAQEDLPLPAFLDEG